MLESGKRYQGRVKGPFPPKRPYTFVAVEGEEDVFLHLERLGDVPPEAIQAGTEITFRASQNRTGIMAEDVELTLGSSTGAEDMTQHNVEGVAKFPFNSKGFLHVKTDTYATVFLHASDMQSPEKAPTVMRGTRLLFEQHPGAIGPIAKNARILSHPETVETQDETVDAWFGDYGFLSRTNYVSGVSVRGTEHGYLQTGDRVTLLNDWTTGELLALEKTGWNADAYSAYEQDLDMGRPMEWPSKLASLAAEEPWDVAGKPELRTLRSYVKNVYLRQVETDNCVIENNVMAFNVGLTDTNGDDIVAVFTLSGHKGPRWRLKEFMPVSASRATRWRDCARAQFWSDPADLIYDHRKGEPVIQTGHIVDGNVDRFPEHMQSWPPDDLARAVREAATNAVKKVRANYKVAIPQFYRPFNGRGDGSTQMLLPLQFPGDPRPSLALAVRREPDGYYGTTVLKLEWAYTYARLLTKPDNEWLDPFHDHYLETAPEPTSPTAIRRRDLANTNLDGLEDSTD